MNGRAFRTPIPVAVLAGLFVVFILPPLVVADEPQKRVEESVFVGQINKWQRIFIRKGVQWPVDHYDNSYYYAIDLEDTTRDREGQGVFVESVSRLLRCYGKDLKVVRDTDEELILEFKFEASQSDGKSSVRLAAKKWPADGEEEGGAYQIHFTGAGVVFDGFIEAFKSATDEAGFVQNAGEIRWRYFPETKLAAPAPLYDLGEVLEGISAGYGRISNGNLTDQRVIEFDVPNDPMAGTITIREFEGGDQSVDVSFSGGDHGWTDRTYYFEGGELFFILDGEGHWRFAEGENAEGERATIDHLRERRYYFHRRSPVRVLEKTASARDADKIKTLIRLAKNREIEAADEAEELQFEAYALLYATNSTALIDFYADGAGSELVEAARKVATQRSPSFDSINAQGVVGDLNDDGEADVVLVSGVRKQLQALAILGPVKADSGLSLVDLQELGKAEQMPRFDVHGIDFEPGENVDLMPGFRRSATAKGVWIEVESETDLLHLYWDHDSGKLAKWRL